MFKLDDAYIHLDDLQRLGWVVSRCTAGEDAALSIVNNADCFMRVLITRLSEVIWDS